MSISNKRGFGLTGGFWNRFGVVFLEAPINLISSALADYFQAKCDRDSLLAIDEVIKKQSRQCNKHFLLQYLGHDWTVWWGFSREEIAFTLSLLLDIKSIVITHNGTSDLTEVKVCQSDRFIEHYVFCFDDRDPNDKFGKYIMGDDGSFLEVVQNINYSGSPLPASYRHIFCSSVRDFTEIEVKNILASRTDEFSLLNNICQFYNVYFPDCSELPYYYSEEKYRVLNSEAFIVNCVELPESAFYWDNILFIPDKVVS